MTTEDRYSFLVEWFDPCATRIRLYTFMYYPDDQTIVMFDVKSQRPFLRRSKVDHIGLKDMYIGSTVNVLNRQLHFIEYGDEFTKKHLGSKRESTIGMIKPDGISKVGQILEIAEENNFLITKLKMCTLSYNEARQLYSEHMSKPFFKIIIGFITSGPVIAFELMGENVVERWKKLLGPVDSAAARSEVPNSIRARFGTDTTANACHGSENLESAARESEFFFPTTGMVRKNTATFTDTTCCVIKPHVVAKRQIGLVIQKIQESACFEITAIQMFKLNQANTEDFLDIYKGVLREYTSMVFELMSGPCVALEIRDKRSSNAPEVFRAFAGPSDPEIARHLRPNSVRAKFGNNKIENGIHCTDLSDDGKLEVEYFFKILDQ